MIQLEEAIDKLKSSSPDAENHDLSELKFALSQRTTQSLEILEDAPLDIEEWVTEQQANEWVVRTVKLWFTLHSAYTKQDFVQFPAILDDQAFFAKAIDVLRLEVEDIATYVKKGGEYFQFTDDVLMRVHALITHLGGVENVNPQGDNTDDQLGAFMMFVIRDAC